MPRTRENRFSPQPFDFEATYHRLHLYDEEAEMSALGAMMLDRDAAMDIMEILSPDDFFKSAHTDILGALRSLVQQNQPIDLLTTKAELERLGKLESAGGYDYLVSLMEATPITANAVHYARLVRQKSVLRTLARACGDILANMEQPGQRLDEIVNYAQGKIFAITHEGRRSATQKMDEILEETFKQILSFRDYADRKSRLLGLSTGLYDLDDLLCGLQPQHLYVLAGRPSMGKSSLCWRILEHVAIADEEPKPALVFSLEMSSSQVCQTMLCSLARVNSHNLRHGRIGEPHFKSLAVAAGKLSDARMWIDDSPDLSIFEMRTRARRMKNKEDIGLIVVDYMQKVRAQPAESRQIEISLVSSQLKSMAKELNVPVIAAAQLNRAAEGRETKRPMLSDLRESGSIEQDADVVMLLYRADYYDQKDESIRGITDLAVAKNRTGPVGDVQLNFQREYTRFENLHRTPQAEG